MWSKRLSAMLLSLVVAVGVMSVPAMAKDVATEDGFQYAWPEGRLIVTPTLYDPDGFYKSTLADMAGRRLQVYGIVDEVNTAGNLEYGEALEHIVSLLRGQFTDVGEDMGLVVAWARAEGITVGTGRETFSPDAPVTRGQAVTLLWRAAGSPEAGMDSPFTDVKVGDYFHDAVLWAAQNGITSGTSSESFNPSDVCTREQVSTMLNRAGLTCDALDDPDRVCTRGEMLACLCAASGAYDGLKTDATRESVYAAVDTVLGWGCDGPEALYAMADAEGLTSDAMSKDGFTEGDLYLLMTKLIDAYDIETEIVREQVSRPFLLTVTADSVAAAESQIKEALLFAPETIKVVFTDSVSDEDVAAFDSYYDDWLKNGNRIDLFIGAIQTPRQFPMSVIAPDREVAFLMSYVDAWFAYVDTQDWLRCYEDEAYSEKLVDFTEQYLNPIAEKHMSNADTAFAALGLLVELADYNTETADASGNDNKVINLGSHCVYGLLDDGLLVCDGFSYAYQFMLAYLGIDSFVMVYDTGDSSHAWNKVKIGGEWYHVDVTTYNTMPPMTTFLGGDDWYQDSHLAGSTPMNDWYETIYASPSDYGYEVH